MGWRKRTQKFLIRLYADETGQGTVEYILILSASLFAATQLSRQIIKSFDKGIVVLGGQLEKDLKTGRAPLHVWEN